MSKFKKSEVSKSLTENISLVQNTDGKYKWVSFDELERYYSRGYRLVNEEKFKLYKEMCKRMNKK